MPCYQPKKKDLLRSEIDSLKKEIDNVSSDKIRQLEAQLCALINELDRRGIAQEIIQEAKKNGGISLDEFWDIHLKEDEIRIAGIIRGLSRDEQELLKKLLDDSLEGKSKYHNPAMPNKKSFRDKTKNPDHS